MNTIAQRNNVLVAALLSIAAAASAQPGYVITDLETLGGEYTFVAAINNTGQAVGRSNNLEGESRAVLWDNGEISELRGLPNDVASAATAISDAGHVAGWFETPDGVHPFLWKDGELTEIDVLPGSIRSEAKGVNDHGQVVGEAQMEGGLHRAFVWENGKLEELPTLPGGISTYALAINNSSQIVGWVFSTDVGRDRAVLWEEGRIRNLGTLPGGESWGSRALAISQSGLITGWSWNRDSKVRAFLWDDGVFQDLGTLGGDDSYGEGVNAAGQVVGHADVEPYDKGPGAAFVYRANVMDNLNEYLHPCSVMNLLHGGRGINDNGEIVGIGYVEHYGVRRTRAFLLTPFSCDDILEVKSRCGKNGRLSATLSTSLPAGASLTLMNNFWGCKPVVIDGKGRAKVKWDVHPDIHAVCVAECWGLCGPSLECP